MATAATVPHDQAAPPTGPPVTLPQPHGRQVHQPASVSPSTVPMAASDATSIPDVALAAYQRSAVVIDTADPSCRLDWALLAAIGQVESDHGQVGGSHLNRHGVAHPPIIGPRLDGRHGTSRVADTDAGRLDGDRRFDRAVGPMQFLPSTWAAVAVDGDGDGRRDVQDINDASLGSAVYLCAAHGDLATKSGQRQALLRYNHSRAYAERVLAIAEQLRTTSLFVATTTISARDISRLRDVTMRGPGQHGHQHTGNPTRPSATATVEPGPTGTTATVVTPTPSGTPTDPTSGSPTPSPPDTPTPTPTDAPTDAPTGTPTGPTDTPSGTPTDNPTSTPTEPPVLTAPLPPELADLTQDQVDADNAAWAACDDDLTAGWSSDSDALTQCLADELGVLPDDSDLVLFVDWLARTQDGAVD